MTRWRRSTAWIRFGWTAGAVVLLVTTALVASMLFQKRPPTGPSPSADDFFATLSRHQWNILHQPSTIEAGSVINYDSPSAPLVIGSVNDCITPPIQAKLNDPEMDIFSRRSFRIDTDAATDLLSNAKVKLGAKANSATATEVRLRNVMVEAIAPARVQSWCLNHKNADKKSKECQNACDPTPDFPIVSEVIKAQMAIYFYDSSGAKVNVEAKGEVKEEADSGYTLNSDGGMETRKAVAIAYRVGVFFPFVIQTPVEGQSFGCTDHQLDVSGSVFAGNHHIYILSNQPGQSDWISEGEATMTSDGRWDASVDLTNRTPSIDGGFAVMIISSINALNFPVGSRLPPSKIPSGDDIGSQAIHISRSCHQSAAGQ